MKMNEIEKKYGLGLLSRCVSGKNIIVLEIP